MHLLNKWFYVIYRSYTKYGDHPDYRSLSTTSTLFIFVPLALEILINGIIYNELHVKIQLFEGADGRKFNIIILMFCSCVFIYFLFIRGGRFQKIYQLYESDETLNSSLAKYVAHGCITLCYLSPLIYALCHNYIVRGRWL
jgi:heme/copper-type cytochrome/quinol oxidase subunit 1